MGEWSKKIGEYGETVVEKFLSIIGWSDIEKGIEIDCKNAEHLNEEKKRVHTHGVDFAYSYTSPLIDGQMQNVVISVKYKTEKYPNSATKQFKWYIEDLNNTLECYIKSESFKEKSFLFKNINRKSFVGVLFWLNNAADSDDDLINKVSNAQLDLKEKEQVIFLMDNKRVAFILSLLSYAKKMNEYKYSFLYPQTGQNINPLIKKMDGTTLPVEYFNSSIIPIKLESQTERSLLLGTSDSFEADTLMRLIGLSQDLAKSFAKQVIIAFPDYDELKHKNIVEATKQGFEDTDYTKTVKVINFNNKLDLF